MLCCRLLYQLKQLHCRKEIGDFQIICSKVGGFRPFNYLLGVTCYLLSLKCKWLVLNKLCNFTAYKLFVSTNKQLSDPMDSMADPLFSSYSEPDKTSPNLIFCFIKISHRIRDLHLMTLSRATRFLTSNCREEAWNRSHVCLRLNAPAVSWPPSAATGAPVSATPVARLVAALGLAGHKTCPLRFLLDFLTRSFVIEYS